jgi:hypothetical protein
VVKVRRIHWPKKKVEQEEVMGGQGFCGVREERSSTAVLAMAARFSLAKNLRLQLLCMIGDMVDLDLSKVCLDLRTIVTVIHEGAADNWCLSKTKLLL